MKILLMYAPVIHAGYMALIEKLAPDRIMIVSDAIATQFDKRRKDLRALQSVQIVEMLKCLLPGIEIVEFNGEIIPEEDNELHMPIEDISDEILKTYLAGRKVMLESVFLRYDSKKSSAQQEVVPDRVVSRDDPFIAAILLQLNEEARLSPDWWRQVPAAVARNRIILSLCHNRHVPTDAVTGVFGDPRSNAKQGLHTNVGKAAHAEPLACFQAGVEGCKGADLFVATFPCPQCANFISFTGVARLFYVEGYAMVDGVEDLRGAGIEIIKVV